MHLHEFLAKELLARRGVAIPVGRVADTAEDASAVARQMNRPRYAVKAQILAGSRGPAGGVRFAEGPAATGEAAAQLIGQRLVTRQTGPRGADVRWVYVEEAVEGIATLYVAVAVDRVAGSLMVLGAPSSSDDMETAAAQDPGLVRRLPVRVGQDGPAADFLGFARDLLPNAAEKLGALLRILASSLVELDATLIELNPLVLTANGQLVALDAKITIDDNALFRHPDLTTIRQVNSEEEEDSIVLEADRHQLNYVGMDGDIGVIANGAGLALATLDMLADAGGRAANFMDIRPSASSLDIAYGLDVLLANPKVRAVLVNVHGGGMQRCDTVADGIGISHGRNTTEVPFVVRLAGNNAGFARQRLQSFGVRFSEGADMWDAARRAVALVSREAA